MKKNERFSMKILMKRKEGEEEEEESLWGRREIEKRIRKESKWWWTKKQNKCDYCLLVELILIKVLLIDYLIY